MKREEAIKGVYELLRLSLAQRSKYKNKNVDTSKWSFKDRKGMCDFLLKTPYVSDVVLESLVDVELKNKKSINCESERDQEKILSGMPSFLDALLVVDSQDARKSQGPLGLDAFSALMDRFYDQN